MKDWYVWEEPKHLHSAHENKEEYEKKTLKIIFCDILADHGGIRHDRKGSIGILKKKVSHTPRGPHTKRLGLITTKRSHSIRIILEPAITGHQC